MALSKPRFLNSLPPNTLFLITALIIFNILIILLLALPILLTHPRLLPAAILSYTLGLRHALDADHIAAIDLTTRRLIASGKRPASVGTFFSLGHSTVVIITCVVVAATSGALRERFDGFARVGNIVGTGVSAVFLVVLCLGNGWVLYGLVGRLRRALERREERYETVEGSADEDVAGQFVLEGGGFLTSIGRGLFKAIDTPWKMYPLGFIFGLGFDTSSEIAILGIASIQAVQGTSIWLILLFPILFTSGMCLLDTTDGALMLALYTSKAFARDHIAILYYSIVLTGITVVVSAFIGIVQVLSLIQNIAEPEGKFWDGVEAIGDYFDVIGGCICLVFLVVGVGSILFYKPWRKRMEAKRNAMADAEEGEEGPSATTPLLSEGQTNENRSEATPE